MKSGTNLPLSCRTCNSSTSPVKIYRHISLDLKTCTRKSAKGCNVQLLTFAGEQGIVVFRNQGWVSYGVRDSCHWLIIFFALRDEICDEKVESEAELISLSNGSSGAKIPTHYCIRSRFALVHTFKLSPEHACKLPRYAVQSLTNIVFFDDTLAGDRRTPVSALGRMSLIPLGA
jgi:hypothetical protein